MSSIAKVTWIASVGPENVAVLRVAERNAPLFRTIEVAQDRIAIRHEVDSIPAAGRDGIAEAEERLQCPREKIDGEDAPSILHVLAEGLNLGERLETDIGIDNDAPD